MTIYGPDVSSYQAGINIAALGAPFVLLKCTEGTFYADAYYERWLAQAKASGKLAIPYHFLSGEDPDAQAAHLAAHIGDKALPVMLDWEPTGTYRPTFAQLLAVADALVRHGLRPKLGYVPSWYHQEIGAPLLAPLTARGMAVVSSSYPNPAAGYAASGGDTGPGWAPYGGVTPLLWQFTDVAVEGGQRVGDMNAFRGTSAQLAAFLGGTAPSPTTSSPTGDDMTPEEHNDLANVYGGMFFGGASMGTTPPGASTNSLVNKLDYLIEQAQKATQAVDVNALAAALGPLLHPSTDVGALAAALIPHLPGTPDPGAFAAALAAHIKVV